MPAAPTTAQPRPYNRDALRALAAAKIRVRIIDPDTLATRAAGVILDADDHYGMLIDDGDVPTSYPLNSLVQPLPDWRVRIFLNVLPAIVDGNVVQCRTWTWDGYYRGVYGHMGADHPTWEAARDDALSWVTAKNTRRAVA